MPPADRPERPRVACRDARPRRLGARLRRELGLAMRAHCSPRRRSSKDATGRRLGPCTAPSALLCRRSAQSAWRGPGGALCGPIRGGDAAEHDAGEDVAHRTPAVRSSRARSRAAAGAAWPGGRRTRPPGIRCCRTVRQGVVEDRDDLPPEPKLPVQERLEGGPGGLAAGRRVRPASQKAPSMRVLLPVVRLARTPLFLRGGCRSGRSATMWRGGIDRAGGCPCGVRERRPAAA